MMGRWTKDPGQLSMSWTVGTRFLALQICSKDRLGEFSKATDSEEEEPRFRS